MNDDKFNQRDTLLTPVWFERNRSLCNPKRIDILQKKPCLGINIENDTTETGFNKIEERNEREQKNDGKCQLEDEVENFKKQIRILHDELVLKQSDLDKLHVYVGTQVTPQVRDLEDESTKEWKKQLESQIEKLQKERDKLLNSQTQFKIRINAMENIISLQQRWQMKNCEEKEANKCNAETLLTRWRHKVYALLVQQKTTDIIHKEELAKNNFQIKSLQDEKETCFHESKLLLSSLENRTAEVNLEKLKVQNLEDKLYHVLQKERELQQLQTKHEGALSRIESSFRSFFSEMTCHEKSFVSSLKMLKELDTRLTFAVSRLDLLKELSIQLQMADKKTCQQSNLNENKSDKEMSDNDPLPFNILEEELHHLRQEQEVLLKRLRADRQKWQEMYTMQEENTKETVKALRERLEETEVQLLEERKKKARLMEEQSKYKTEAEEAKCTIQQLANELESKKENNAIAFNNQQIKHQNQIIELETKLEEARREQVKAIIAQQHAERETNIIKHELEEKLTGFKESSQSEMIQLKNRLQSLEREKNVLTAVIHHYGLTDQFKSARKSPLPLKTTSLDMSQPSKNLSSGIVGKKKPEENIQTFHHPDLQLIKDTTKKPVDKEGVDEIKDMLKELSSTIKNISEDGIDVSTQQ
ncbi:coiled-coil alpha-helical rod protein 1-like [Limulus polyphemus]|uniref:Coiled-coil alpha-helical rod protein 1 n=1 Tax=Limulus polyphemus TaxID=6850 RepID=A0ABM1S474_LIMPO|nr:coiled-coil alpha-helical rod protein 1-like [Limulus polyphemus]XP_022238430.1 coiled-coil alpha-helical rod protein 1-like [Limulus polyphemus]XP_022238431.1 coiled-coil alpha-helical rod protein 1-like [Limulus polyphemus]XP_022238433.1 coiled-coil alpha-helical rod protein 1-like [Limulus polyphemus]